PRVPVPRPCARPTPPCSCAGLRRCPATLGPIVVRHKSTAAAGRPLKCNTVPAEPAERVWATDGSIVQYRATTQIDANGQWELELPYVDQEGIRNKGVPWRVAEHVPGQPRSYFVAPVLAHGAGPIDFAECLVSAPTGRETVIQAGPVTDEAAASLLAQDGEFKAALMGTIESAVVDVLHGLDTGKVDITPTVATAGSLTVRRTTQGTTIHFDGLVVPQDTASSTTLNNAIPDGFRPPAAPGGGAISYDFRSAPRVPGDYDGGIRISSSGQIILYLYNEERIRGTFSYDPQVTNPTSGALIADPNNPGLYLLGPGLTEDPNNPGLYLA